MDWASQYFREGNWGQKPLTPEEEEANDARPDGLLDVRVWALQPHIQAVPSVFGPLLATATSAAQPGGSVEQAAAAAATATASAAASSSSSRENNGGPSHDWLILEAGDGVFYRMSVGPSGWRQRMLPSLDSSNGYMNNADQATNVGATGAATTAAGGRSDVDRIGVLMSPEEEASRPIDPNTGYPMRDRHQEILVSGVAAVATDRFIPGPRGGRGIRGAAGTGRGVATVRVCCCCVVSYIFMSLHFSNLSFVCFFLLSLAARLFLTTLSFIVCACMLVSGAGQLFRGHSTRDYFRPVKRRPAQGHSRDAAMGARSRRGRTSSHQSEARSPHACCGGCQKCPSSSSCFFFNNRWRWQRRCSNRWQ